MNASIVRRGRPYAALALAGLLGAATGAAEPAFLSPPPAREQGGEARLTARAYLRETPLTAETREKNDPDTVPPGALRVRARMEVDGYPALDHHAWRLPPELMPGKLPDYPKFLRLPDGGAYAAKPILGGQSHRNFPSWGFFNLSGTLKGQRQSASLLEGTPCVAANAFTGDGWASAELVFERPLESGERLSVTLRIRRVPGDPFLYLLVLATPSEADAARSVSLSGIPFASNPPKHASWERAMWAMGRAWNMHDKEQVRRAEVTPECETGVFWHNLGYGESAGMSAVFLSEEVCEIGAGGTWMAGLTLRFNGPMLRVAIHEWEDFRGWERALATFREELSARQRRLRETVFAWPLDDVLGASERAEAARYLASPALAGRMRQEAQEKLKSRVEAFGGEDDADDVLQVLQRPAGEDAARLADARADARAKLEVAQRDAARDPLLPLREAVAAYDAARAALAALPVADSAARFTAERDVLRGAATVRERLEAARRVWVREGGLGVEG